MRKRILSLLLALLMVVTLMPAAALADTEMKLDETVEYVKTDDNESAVFTFTPTKDGEYQLYVTCPEVTFSESPVLFLEYEDNGTALKREIHTDSIRSLYWLQDVDTGDYYDYNGINLVYELKANVEYKLSFDIDFTGKYSVTVHYYGAAVTAADVDETTFPDNNFRDYVSNYCDFNGDGKLSENEIARIEILSVNYRNIASIEGIENFTSLTNLSCSGNQIEEISKLPDSLLWLNCSVNKLTALPELPSNLSSIGCSGNQLTAMPELPETLVSLYCSDNQLTALPANLSELENLWMFNCSYNQLTALPELPSTLVNLYCSDNQLTVLPKLPSTLETLVCSENLINSLENLPETLRHLDCANNQLTSMPDALPNGLEILNVGGNKINKIESIPEGITSFSCFNCGLTVLPELPSTLEDLYCFDNQLTALPELPASLSWLVCYNNNLESITLNPDADYSYINATGNSFSDYSAVTGKDIVWNDNDFIFGEQNHEHAYVIEITTEPTCRDYGWQIVTCSKCGYENEEGIEPLSHDFGDDNKCKSCDQYKCELGEVSHDFNENSQCSMCGGYICMLTNELHEFNDAGVCTICGNSIPEPYTAEDGSVWTLTKDGVLTISGAKSVNSYSEAMEYFKPFLQNTLKIVCADGTTVFESYYKFSKVKELSLGKDVQAISSPHSLNSLEKVTVYAENPYLCAEGGVLYSKDGSKLLLYPKILGGTWSESITVKEGVTSIEDLAFYNHAVLKHLILPESLVNIGAQAFLYCYSLESVSIPSSTTSIGYRAFYGCNSLTDVYYSGTEEQWNAISIDDDNDCIASLTINYNHEHSYENGVCTECGASDGTATILGDLNGDKKVDISDLIRLKKYIADSSTEINGSADLNGDNDVNILDLIRLKKMIAGGDI